MDDPTSSNSGHQLRSSGPPLGPKGRPTGASGSLQHDGQDAGITSRRATIEKASSGRRARNAAALHRHPGRRIPNRRDDRQSASSTRLHRAPIERWDGLEKGRRFGKIEVLQHGGNARPIINRGSKHLRSRNSSRKTGLQQITEGKGLRDLTMLCEVSPEVLDYQAHPFHIQLWSSGARFSYYPDLIRLRRGVGIELIEVKRTPEDLSDPAYREKLGHVAELARLVGWKFRVLYEADITGPPDRMRNVEDIYMCRFMRLSREEQLTVSNFVAIGQPAPWGDLRAKVCPHDELRGDAVLSCCIALGRISVDLDASINARTVVTPCEQVMRPRGFRI